MTDRSPWLVALATANFIVLVALAVLAKFRFESIEARLESKEGAGRPTKARPDATSETPGKDDIVPARKPGTGREVEKEGQEPKPGSPADVTKRLQKLSDDLYDDYSDLSNDLHQMKMTLNQVNSAVKKIQHAIAAPGTPAGEWLLGPRATGEKPLSAETLESYRRDAMALGVAIEPGRVVVRGFLNMSPWTTMPIEYFVTRYPEAGHETLLHLMGALAVEDASQSPERLRQLVTSVYKGMVVAGFVEGSPSQVAPPAPGDKEGHARWIAPKGDDVYVGVRYSLGGVVHVARATDWVIDPDTRAVLPETSFKFTGSIRQDDFTTGDEQLSAEASGIAVSVYGNPNTLIEIALADNLENRYQYNHARIPKPAVLRLGKDGPLLEGVRDRAKGSLTLKTIERDGKRSPIEKAPTLVGRTPNGDTVEVEFAKADDGWTVTSEALAKGDWRVRAELDGKPVETTGFDLLYVDLIFSKTPIVPEGDGAKPIEAPELPAELPTGTGRKPPGGGPPAVGPNAPPDDSDKGMK